MQKNTVSNLMTKRASVCFLEEINCAKEPFIVEGDEIKVSESAVHLGHRISSSDKHVGIKGASSNFWKGFNMFINVKFRPRVLILKM